MILLPGQKVFWIKNWPQANQIDRDIPRSWSNDPNIALKIEKATKLFNTRNLALAALQYVKVEEVETQYVSIFYSSN